MHAEVVIVGGGISGLIAAHYLIQRGLSVIVLEAASEPGGLACCLEQSGFFIENLYHHFFEHDLEALQLLQELRLSANLHWGETRTGVYLQGKWYHASTSLDLMKLAPLPPLERFKLGYYLLWAKYARNLSALDALSVHDWLHLHEREALYPIMNQLLHSKFGVGVRDASAAFLCGRFKARAARRGILPKRERFGYLQGSLHRMLTTLSSTIEQQGGTIARDARVVEIERRNQEYRIRLPDNNVISAKAILSTIPPHDFAALATFLSQADRARFQQIRYIGVVCTLVSLRSSLMPFYWGTVVDERVPCSVVIEHTRLLQPASYDGEHLVYAARYLPEHRLRTLDVPVWERDLTAALADVAYAHEMPRINWLKTSIFPNATPMYGPGFGAWRAQLPVIDGLWMTGAPFTYPESRNINSMIRHTRQQADDIARWFGTNFREEGVRR